MATKKQFTTEEAKKIGETLGLDWSRFDVEQFRMGLDVELEHGAHDPVTDVTQDDPILTGKIALAHLNEYPDYYTRLEKMEREAERSHVFRAEASKIESEVRAELAKIIAPLRSGIETLGAKLDEFKEKNVGRWEATKANLQTAGTADDDAAVEV